MTDIFDFGVLDASFHPPEPVGGWELPEIVVAIIDGYHPTLIDIINKDVADPYILEEYNGEDLQSLVVDDLAPGIYKTTLNMTCNRDYWGEIDCEYEYGAFDVLDFHNMQWVSTFVDRM